MWWCIKYVIFHKFSIQNLEDLTCCKLSINCIWSHLNDTFKTFHFKIIESLLNIKFSSNYRNYPISCNNIPCACVQYSQEFAFETTSAIDSFSILGMDDSRSKMIFTPSQNHLAICGSILVVFKIFGIFHINEMRKKITILQHLKQAMCTNILLQQQELFHHKHC